MSDELKCCPDCNGVFKNIDNDFRGECLIYDDKIETYNHNYLRVDYCSRCGYVLRIIISEKEGK